MNLVESLEVFLSHLIDYAGLFSRANLLLEIAFRNYDDYTEGVNAWKLGRFIYPASRLEELGSFRKIRIRPKKPIVLSVLGDGGGSPEDFLKALKMNLLAISKFLNHQEGRTVIDVLESHLPIRLIQSTNGNQDFRRLIDSAAEVVKQFEPPALRPFYEVLLEGNWQKILSEIMEVLFRHRSRVLRDCGFGRYRPAGFKLRCGGLDPSVFPSPKKVAVVIYSCRELEIPLKTTAGLHHSIRHYNKEGKVRMHGFMNLIAAAVLSRSHKLDRMWRERILSHEYPENFVFRWKDWRASVAAIRAARCSLFISYGSSIFDEPCLGLRSLGWL